MAGGIHRAGEKESFRSAHIPVEVATGRVNGPLTPIDFLSPLKDRHVAMQSLDRFPIRDTDLDPDDHEAREQIEMEAAEAKADQERDGI